MNDLRFEKFRIKGAHLGEPSCMPDILNDNYIHSGIEVLPEITEEERKYIGKGSIRTLLPYTIQNSYDRARVDVEFDSAVLENDYLRATFVTSLGGRLWSLYDKKQGRELLYSNDVFQPCNLALRNAWVCGGVEWNIGIRGHHPYTCSPMFAERLEDKDGNPMLRMYEFERIRGVAYSVTAKLDGDTLLVHPVIENTSDDDTYMYWWSNIAVEETPETRVVSPASSCFLCSYKDGGNYLGNADIPVNNGVDVTYTVNLKRAQDFFYKIPKSEKKWITAVGADGYGLVQVSDDTLRGRKIFAWGEGSGGKRWNRWLSDCGRKYIEIQAGILQTQMEHFVMSKNTVIEWTEGYGALISNPELIHGEDYTVAINEVKSHITGMQTKVETADFNAVSDGEIIFRGSGWGALENAVRNNPVSNILKFPEDSTDDDCARWFELCRNGVLTVPDKALPIKSYVKGDRWIELLSGSADSWYKYNHLGVALYEKGDVDGAYSAFAKSVELESNAWAYRNLAQIEKNIRKDTVKAVAFMEKAITEKADYQPLWVNFGESLFANGEYGRWAELYETRIPENLKDDGRLKFMYITALSETDRFCEAAELLTPDFELPDIQEGERSVSALWIMIYKGILESQGAENPDEDYILERYPLPDNLDFRMS